jgi:hypothetical protein
MPKMAAAPNMSDPLPETTQEEVGDETIHITSVIVGRFPDHHTPRDFRAQSGR